MFLDLCIYMFPMEKGEGGEQKVQTYGSCLEGYGGAVVFVLSNVQGKYVLIIIIKYDSAVKIITDF